MRYLIVTILFSLTLIMNGCTKDFFTVCPKLTPADMNITTDRRGGLDAHQTYKLWHVYKFLNLQIHDYNKAYNELHGKE